MSTKKGKAKAILKIKCLSCGAVEVVPSPYCLLCESCTVKNNEAYGIYEKEDD
ncbi:MAG TPA: hypothetical protein VGB78_08910 [Thermoplasmata archaeon]